MAQLDYTSVSPRTFPTHTWGTTLDYATMKAALNDCNLPVESGLTLNAVLREGLERQIRRHHAYVLSALNEAGLVDYDLYPHHIWSNPWQFHNFKFFDKRKIVAYRVSVQAVCLSPNFSDAPRVVASEEFTINLTPKSP